MTFEEASAAFLYDADTGIVRWRETRGGRIAGSPAGSVSGRYVWIKFNRRYYSAHQIAWLLHYQSPANARIDHKDGDGRNNRIGNLRKATQSENSQNRRVRSDNAAGIKGVQFRGPGKWRARIFLGGRSVNIGHFPTAEEAHAAYTREAARHFGKFARPQ